MADNEITYQDCLMMGFILSLITFLAIALYVFSQGWYLEPMGIEVFIILGIAIAFGIGFLTLLIFTPIVYIIRKYVIPKL